MEENIWIFINDMLDGIHHLITRIDLARIKISKTRERRNFLGKFSPEEIVTLNLWQRKSRQLFLDVMEMETFLLSYERRKSEICLLPKAIFDWYYSISFELGEIEQILCK